MRLQCIKNNLIDFATSHRAKNLAYEELCKIREGNDKYTERGMQTFNNALKNKDIQAEKVRSDMRDLRELDNINCRFREERLLMSNFYRNWN